MGGHVFGVGDVLPGGGQNVGLRAAEDLAHGPVHLQPAAVEAHDCHADRRVLEGQAEPLLALLERGQGLAGAPAQAHGVLVRGLVAQGRGDDLGHDLQRLRVAVVEGARLGRHDGEGADRAVQVVEGDDEERAGAELEGEVPVDAGVAPGVVAALGVPLPDGGAREASFEGDPQPQVGQGRPGGAAEYDVLAVQEPHGRPAGTGELPHPVHDQAKDLAQVGLRDGGPGQPAAVSWIRSPGRLPLTGNGSTARGGLPGAGRRGRGALGLALGA